MRHELLTPTRRQVADWARLTQRKSRSRLGQFLIEGEICTREALTAGIQLDGLLVMTTEAERWESLCASASVPCYLLKTDEFRRVSSVEASQGIAAVGRQFQLKPRPSKLVMACEKISDPGNCGALIRAADFFGAGELFLGPDSVEIWNGKVVRGSMGSLFHQPVRQNVNLAELIQNWPGSTAALVAHGGKPVTDKPDVKRPVLLVLGHETRGLSENIEKLCSHKFTLKPKGKAESLNLTAAAAVFAYAFSS